MEGWIPWDPVGPCGILQDPPWEAHSALPRVSFSSTKLPELRSQPRISLRVGPHHETPLAAQKTVLKTCCCFLEGGGENNAGLFSSGQGFCTALSRPNLCALRATGRFSSKTTSDTRSLSRASPASFGLLLLLTQHHQRYLPLSHKGKPDPPTHGTARSGLGAELAQGFYCVLPRPAEATQEG